MNEKMKPDLLPCPFCGEPAHLDTGDSTTLPFLVGCEGIGCLAYQHGKTEEAAIVAWNRRVK